MTPEITKLIERAQTQLRMGIAHAQRGDFIGAESWLLPAQATLSSLQALLDGPAQKPMRKLCVVQKPRDEELPEWMTKRHGGDDGNGAA